MKKVNETELLEKQYRTAIDARDKLADNYHKWMSFYYIANGAILVTNTTFVDKSPNDHNITLLFAFIGIFTCITWNLSCRGYYYWSLSWIDIIMHMESKLANNNIDLMPYSIFSKEVADKFENRNSLTAPSNISTPKLTMRFSIFAIACWSLFFDYELHWKFTCLSESLQIVIGIAVLFFIFCFILLYPQFVISRASDKHKLISFQQFDNNLQPD